MRPMSFINGVIFGSAVALGGVLGVILFFRYVLSLDDTLDQTVIRSNLPLGELLRDMLAFSVFAVLAGFAFWGQLTNRRWRWVVEYVLVLAIVVLLIVFLAPADSRHRDLAILAGVAVAGGIVWAGGCYSGLSRRIRAWLEEG